MSLVVKFHPGGEDHITPIVIHETPSDVSRWRRMIEFRKKYFMENIMRDITELIQ